MTDSVTSGTSFTDQMQGILDENQSTDIETAQQSAQQQKLQAEQSLMTEEMTDNNKALSAVTKADQSISY